MKNGVPTGFGCTVIGSSWYAPRSPCAATTGSVTYAAGDTLSLKVAAGSSPLVHPPTALHWTAAFASP